MTPHHAMASNTQTDAWYNSVTCNFNLPPGCTLSDINDPEPLVCDVCGEQFYGEKPREIGDVVRCGECDRKENND